MSVNINVSQSTYGIPCRRRDLSFDSAGKGDSENRGCRELVAGMPV